MNCILCGSPYRTIYRIYRGRPGGNSYVGRLCVSCFRDVPTEMHATSWPRPTSAYYIMDHSSPCEILDDATQTALHLALG